MAVAEVISRDPTRIGVNHAYLFVYDFKVLTSTLLN